jgi:hypothetical protein
LRKVVVDDHIAFFDLVLDGFLAPPAPRVTARPRMGLRCWYAARRESFDGADDFEVVANGVRSLALEYGGPKTKVYSPERGFRAGTFTATKTTMDDLRLDEYLCLVFSGRVFGKRSYGWDYP